MHKSLTASFFIACLVISTYTSADGNLSNNPAIRAMQLAYRDYTQCLEQAMTDERTKNAPAISNVLAQCRGLRDKLTGLTPVQAHEKIEAMEAKATQYFKQLVSQSG